MRATLEYLDVPELVNDGLQRFLDQLQDEHLAGRRRRRAPTSSNAERSTSSTPWGPSECASTFATSPRSRIPRPVRESHNVLRACPMSDARQELLSYRVCDDAGRARLLLRRLLGHARRRVRRRRAAHAARGRWSRRRVPDARARGPLTACPRLASLRDTGLRRRAPGVPRAVAAHRVGRGRAARRRDPRRERRRRRRRRGRWRCTAPPPTTLTYTPGSTYVGMDVNEVFARKTGVCQDYAHCMVAMCRSVGIPARYVSGYLLDRTRRRAPRPPRDDSRGHDPRLDRGRDSRAPAGGASTRPTTRRSARAHVKIAHGRDYDDVAPLRGVYHGPAAHRLDVSVKIAHARRRPAAATERPPRTRGAKAVGTDGRHAASAEPAVARSRCWRHRRRQRAARSERARRRAHGLPASAPSLACGSRRSGARSRAHRDGHVVSALGELLDQTGIGLVGRRVRAERDRFRRVEVLLGQIETLRRRGRPPRFGSGVTACSSATRYRSCASAGSGFTTVRFNGPTSGTSFTRKAKNLAK